VSRTLLTVLLLTGAPRYVLYTLTVLLLTGAPSSKALSVHNKSDPTYKQTEWAIKHSAGAFYAGMSLKF